MQKLNGKSWHDHLPESEQAAIDLLRDAGFHTEAKFT